MIVISKTLKEISNVSREVIVNCDGERMLLCMIGTQLSSNIYFEEGLVVDLAVYVYC